MTFKEKHKLLPHGKMYVHVGIITLCLTLFTTILVFAMPANALMFSIYAQLCFCGFGATVAQYIVVMLTTDFESLSKE